MFVHIHLWSICERYSLEMDDRTMTSFFMTTGAPSYNYCYYICQYSWQALRHLVQLEITKLPRQKPNILNHNYTSLAWNSKYIVCIITWHHHFVLMMIKKFFSIFKGIVFKFRSKIPEEIILSNLIVDIMSVIGNKFIHIIVLL